VCQSEDAEAVVLYDGHFNPVVVDNQLVVRKGREIRLLDPSSAEAIGSKGKRMLDAFGGEVKKLSAWNDPSRNLLILVAPDLMVGVDYSGEKTATRWLWRPGRLGLQSAARTVFDGEYFIAADNAGNVAALSSGGRSLWKAKLPQINDGGMVLSAPPLIHGGTAVFTYGRKIAAYRISSGKLLYSGVGEKSAESIGAAGKRIVTLIDGKLGTHPSDSAAFWESKGTRQCPENARLIGASFEYAALYVPDEGGVDLHELASLDEGNVVQLRFEGSDKKNMKPEHCTIRNGRAYVLCRFGKKSAAMLCFDIRQKKQLWKTVVFEKGGENMAVFRPVLCGGLFSISMADAKVSGVSFIDATDGKTVQSIRLENGRFGAAAVVGDRLCVSGERGVVVYGSTD